MKKGLSRIKMGIRALVGVVGGYLGVISTILGTIFGILASILVVGLIAGICVYVKVIPMFTEAREVVFDNLVNMTEEDFVMNEDTLVFDDKGKKIGSVNAGRFTYTKISKISPYIYNGYIAVEDKRFKTHGGVDLLATMRASVALLKNRGEITQGGSTITQQVIKNNLLSLSRPLRERLRRFCSHRRWSRSLARIRSWSFTVTATITETAVTVWQRPASITLTRNRRIWSRRRRRC